MKLSDIEREDVEDAITRVGNRRGRLPPKLAVLGFIAHRLDLVLERLTDLVHYAHKADNPIPHLPEAAEMLDLGPDRYTYAARCEDCGIGMIIDYHPTTLDCPACGKDDLSYMRLRE